MAYVNKLPSATDLILNILKNSPEAIQTVEICKKTSLSKRQVRYVLDFLIKNQIVVRVPNLYDLRVNLYSIAVLEEQDSK